ncbi:PA2169 family four-helix-bundle protein [Blastopirellula sp. JC732]|uniref:PA2169 family four-helix-bundle protein n=1 Tax=Blastopirellula sediminis TaxID=2894196 RepID=A0A9X1SI02_9BACT|nr:PA2169 family four-helix-bundle protein [Blastopirellula sediminis]MCC9606014.1 PA2169 family four-helix-bundle protein [Blastopirellula sediminis]MCC9630687.1 PA2169 family four-helix-bundle protein [Blastopirellula sediminis]
MSLETKLTLNESTIEKLQTLIRANIDSYDGFREAAHQIDDPLVAELFREMAAERSTLAAELQDYVTWNNKKAEDDGSYAAALHRTWIDIRALLSGGDAYAILCEVERGEDHIKHAYEDALKATVGSAMNDVLQHQYAQVKQGHDRVRDLRDAFKSNS